MKRLLIINPNTTAAMTERVAAAARAALPDVSVEAATGRFGCAYIASRASYAVAGHAALDCLAASEAFDAVLLACFGDPGLDALREVAAAPVVGLVEAACGEAAAGGRRYGIVTGGALWEPMLTEQVRLRKLDAGLAGIAVVAPTGGAIAADPAGALDVLTEAARICFERDGAEAVILGGVGLIGLAEPIADRLGRPVICSVAAGLRAAAAALAEPHDRSAAALPPVSSIGLAPTLEQLFARGGRAAA
jgi:Asp/Glu/hydantoin racemase